MLFGSAEFYDAMLLVLKAYFVFYLRILYNRIIYDTLTFTIHINGNIFEAGFFIQFIIKLLFGS